MNTNGLHTNHVTHPADENPADQGTLAIFLPSLAGAGAERVLLNLANGMAAIERPVDLVLSRADGPYLAQVASGIRVVDLGAARALSSTIPLANYLKQACPTVLLTALHANFIAVAAKRLSRTGVRVVVTQHIHMASYAARASNWRARLEPQFARYAFPSADGIIAVSDGVAMSLVEASGIQRETIDVIYNPVIMPDMAKKKKELIAHPWFVEGQPPVIIGVGRLAEQKGFSSLIDAFAIVRTGQQCRLVVLGEGEDRDVLEQQAVELGIGDDVWLPGFVDNPYAYMARSSVFVLSSIHEGLPTVLVEALYCDLPVVSTDCPSGPYEILDGGRFGRLVSVGDVDALAHGIQDALNGTTPKPVEESWTRFTLGTALAQYQALLFSDGRTEKPPLSSSCHSHDL